jgi:hypothetical protein
MTNAERIEHVTTWPKKPGKADYLRYLQGEQLTRAQTIKAMCYSCTAGEAGPCTASGCPILPFSQWNT